MKNVQADVLLIMGICDTKFTWQDINQESVRYLTSITNILMSAKEAGIKQVIYCSSLGSTMAVRMKLLIRTLILKQFYSDADGNSDGIHVRRAEYPGGV